MRRFLPRSTEELILWYERYVSPISLLVGFALDVSASQVLELRTYGLVLIGYLLIATVSLLSLHLVERGRAALMRPVAQFLPVFAQFAFGGLFSGFVILYSKSASFATSWVFVVLLATLLLGNERFRRLYGTLPVQVGILFVALYSFCIFYLPILFSSVGDLFFYLSGAFAFAGTGLFLLGIAYTLPELWKESRVSSVRGIVSLYVLINALYLVNAIPPLPLALKDAGVFHSVVRSGTTYTVTYEPREWYEVYLRYETEFRRLRGEPVYVYTAVFAPSGISTGLVHEWEWYDPVHGEWVLHDEVPFPISGGRAGGYRGYTLQRTLPDGDWRVNVKTDFGRTIGRVNFNVVTVTEAPVLEEGIR
jgi:hypothetical protein